MRSSCWPKNVKARISATATRPAIRPYSMAVAASSSARNCLISLIAHPSQQIAQGCDERLVRRRHGVVAQTLRTHPFEGRMLPGVRRALPLSAYKKWHQKVKVFVRMGRECQRCETGGLGGNPQLLLELADQRRLRSLPRF